ncbi:MAG: hypothetical protein IKY34_04725 [Ruminiclostridium sp.]|nr:hypothetical protein [Ruminiclostridium sp.]
MGTDRCGFTFLPSYYDALRPLPDEERLALFDAILDYVFQGKEPDLPPLLNCCFSLLRPNVDASVKRYQVNVENGKRGGRPTKQKPNKNPSQTQEEPNENPRETERKPGKNQEKETEKETEKEFLGANESPKKNRFVPPSLDEVRAYCRERGNSVDPQRFLAHYEASGWMRGKTKISDWRAAVRTWERNDVLLNGAGTQTEEPRRVTGHFVDENGEVVFT